MEANHLIDELSVFEEEDRWDAHNLISLSDIARSIDIELCDLCPSAIFIREFLYNRSDGLAWSAPISVHIDESYASGNGVVKIRRSEYASHIKLLKVNC